MLVVMALVTTSTASEIQISYPKTFSYCGIGYRKTLSAPPQICLQRLK